MRKPLLLILLLSMFLAGGSLNMPKAQAEDNCPALILTDIPSELMIKEIYSNDKTAKYAIRLFWKNSIDTAPTSTAIFRKKSGQPFEKLGDVSGNTSTYLDTSANSKDGGYIYYLESTYYCGGTLSSHPKLYLMQEQLDTTKPQADELFEDVYNKLLDNERFFFFVSDQESAIKNSSFKISTKDEAGKIISRKISTSYGNAHAQFIEIRTDQFEKDTNHEITLSGENSVGSPLDKISYGFEVLSDNKNQFTISNPKPASFITLGSIFTLTGTIPEGNKKTVTWSYSSNKGTTWNKLATSTVDENNQTKADVTVPVDGINDNYILIKGEIQDENGIITGRDTIPLFVGNTSLDVLNNGNFVAGPFGNIQIMDSYTAQITKFTKDSPAFIEAKPFFLRLDISPIYFSIAPGYYYMTLSDSNAIPISKDSNVSIQYLSHEISPVRIYTLPIAVFTQNRTALDNNDVNIINGDTEPPSLINHISTVNEAQRIRSLPPIDKNTTELTSIESDSKPLLPIDVQMSLCTTAGRCIADKYATTDAKEVNITYESVFQNFKSEQFLQTFSYKDISQKNYLAIDNAFTIILPKGFQSHIEDGNEFIIKKLLYPNNQVFYSITLPFSLVSYIYESGNMLTMENLGGTSTCANTGFSLQKNGTSVPMQSLCKDSTLKTMLFPQTKFVMGITKTPGVDAKIYDESQITDGITNITRGELAYLISRSIFFPTGQYQNDTSTFADLPENHKYTRYLLGMVAYYIMSGNTSGSKTMLRPNDPVTRVEALKMIIKSFGGLTYSSNIKLPFVDIESNQWYYKYLVQAYSNGAISGYTENKKMYFKPKNSITKGEAIALIKQLMKAKMN